MVGRDSETNKVKATATNDTKTFSICFYCEDKQVITF